MQFLWSKKGIAIIILILVVLFGVDQSGVLGDTRIGITLRTNSDLNQGLVAHYTFDSRDVNGFTVTDSSGSGNDGSIVATSSPLGETAVDTLISSSVFGSPMPRIAWISDQIAYKVYRDQNSNDAILASTTDGGATWNGERIIGSEFGRSAFDIGLWYDRWTPGNTTGNVLHIQYLDENNDDTLYVSYDTSDNTLSTYATGTDQSATISTQNTSYITRAANGDLFMAATDTSDSWVVRCSQTCTESANWSELTPYPFTDGVDFIMLFPYGLDGNVMAINWDATADLVEYDVYSATSSSWWGNATVVSSIEDNTIKYGDLITGAVHPKTGDIYFAVVDDANDYVTQDHDVVVWKYDIDAQAWNVLTEPLTDVSGGLTDVSLTLDAQREGLLYLMYTREGTIGTITTRNIYYKVSTDDGLTWSGENGPLATAGNSITELSSPVSSDEKVSISWRYATINDMYFRDVVDISDYTDEKLTTGNIGQGMVFDGVDDYVDIETPLSPTCNFTPNDWTAGGWFKYDPDPPVSAQHTIFSVGDHIGGNKSGFFIFRNGTGGTMEVTLWVDTNVQVELETDETFTNTHWRHVVARKSGTTLSLYVDGQVATSSTISSGTMDYTGDFCSITIGHDTSVSTRLFPGEIDDVRMYERALSPSEISRLYDLGATTKIGKTLDTNPDLQNGLVGHWTFDGKDTDWDAVSAEILDKTGNGHTANMVNNTEAGVVPGAIGQAFDFNQSNDYARVANADNYFGSSTMTVAAWIKPRAMPSSTFGVVVAHGSASNSGFTFAICNAVPAGCSSQPYTFQLYKHFSGADGNWRTPTNSIRVNEWQHVAVTYDSTLTTNDPVLYIDGVPVTVTETTAPTGTSDDSGPNLDIGDFTAENYDGFVDDVRYYNRILSPDEVARLYDLGATTKINKTLDTNPDISRGLVGHWSFDGQIENAISNLGSYAPDAYFSTTTGEATSTRLVPGVMGQAVALDGVNDFIHIGTEQTNLGLFDAGTQHTDATVALWVRPEIVDQDTVYFQIGGVERAFGLGLRSTGVVRFALDRNATADRFVDSTEVLNASEWVHLAGTNDSSGSYLYINGIEVNSTAGSYAFDVGLNGAGIGAAHDEQEGDGVESVITDQQFAGDLIPRQLLQGRVDDVRVYDRALSPAEILRLYQLGSQ